MRTLQFAYLGPTAPFNLVHVVSAGQSLSVGFESTVQETTQPFSNVMLHDSAGTYDITLPNAATLSMQPLVSPQRSPGTGEYPSNIAGESVDISFANAIVALTPGSGYVIASSAVGAGGMAMADIDKGGTGPAYAASLYECRAFKHLNGAASFGVTCVLLTHGEADALLSTDPTVYEAQVVSLQANYESDLKGITGQSQSVPMLVTQQSSFPHGFQGENVTALSVWLAAVANPKIVLVGPKYQFPYATDTRVHFPDYRPLGELIAKIYLATRTAPWVPLWPTAFARVGTAVTITFHVPTLPLVFDGVASPPHGVGTPWSMWGPGKGFEVYDRPLTIDTATNATPIVCHSTTPHGLTSGESYALQGGNGNTAVNGVWAVTVIDASHFSLDGSVGNGALSAPITGFSPIGIASAPVISGNQVSFTLARQPIGGTGVIAYAHHADMSWLTGQSLGTGGFPDGRCGLLRDSDPFVGPITRTALPNWCIEFAQSIA